MRDTGTALVDINSDPCRVVMGRTVNESIAAYQYDEVFAYAIDTLAYLREDSIPFLLQPTDHVYKIAPEYLGLVE